MFAPMIEMREHGFNRMLVMFFLFVEVTQAGSLIDAGIGLDGPCFHKQLIDEGCLA